MPKKHIISFIALLVLGVIIVFALPSTRERLLKSSVNSTTEETDHNNLGDEEEAISDDPEGIIASDIRIQAFPTYDEGEDPSFDVFFERLRQVVKDRDGDQFAEYLADDTLCSFGGHYGPKDCIFIYGLDDPDAEIWQDLDRMMQLGALYDIEAQRYGIPSVWWSLYDIDYQRTPLDPFLSYVVIGKEIPVYAEPTTESEIIAHATYDLVSEFFSVAQKTTPGWLGVSFIDDTFGYIESSYLYSFVGYRMGIEQRDGTWVITLLVAGD